MWFWGKKFKRTRCENVDAWMDATKVNEEVRKFLMKKTPVFSFTKLDDKTIKIVIEMDDRVVNRVYELGVEQEVEKIDGTKLLFKFTLEGDNIINHYITQSDGRVTYFKREFSEKELKMTISIDNSDIKAIIYFEEVK